MYLVPFLFHLVFIVGHPGPLAILVNYDSSCISCYQLDILSFKAVCEVMFSHFQFIFHIFAVKEFVRVRCDVHSLAHFDSMFCHCTEMAFDNDLVHCVNRLHSDDVQSQVVFGIIVRFMDKNCVAIFTHLSFSLAVVGLYCLLFRN